MNSREVSVWMDERWYDAIQRQHPDQTMEELAGQFFDSLKLQLPKDEMERITQEIRQEDEQRAAEAEAGRRFSLACVTENSDTKIQLLERGEDLFSTAQRLRRYLRGGGTFPELYPAAAELTSERAEQYTAEAVGGSPRVVGVYDIDLDKGEFSALDINYGWRTYRTRDISTAVYHATKKESADWVEKRHKFYGQIEGMDCNPSIRPVYIRGTEPLPVDAVLFESDIQEMAGRFLNFYVPVHFDPDRVFGTHVGTAENDDWLNIYAEYDMKTGSVKDALEVCLVRGDGTELCCQYRLTEEQQAALLPKMDTYCQEQMGITLKEARAQYLEEQAAAPPPLLSRVERERQDMHQNGMGMSQTM